MSDEKEEKRAAETPRSAWQGLGQAKSSSAEGPPGS